MYSCFGFLMSDWHRRLFDPRIRIHQATILGAGYSPHLVNLRQIWLTLLRYSQMSWSWTTNLLARVGTVEALSCAQNAVCMGRPQACRKKRLKTRMCNAPVYRSVYPRMPTGNEDGWVVHSAGGGRACCAHGAAATGGADEGVLEVGHLWWTWARCNWWRQFISILTNLGGLPLDHIQTMLKFVPGYDRMVDQFCVFMDTARLEGLISVKDGIWRLNWQLE